MHCKTGNGALLIMQQYVSLGSFLEDARSLFPPALMGDSGWDRLRQLALRLPFCVTDARFGFEFHLCDPNPTADLCVISAPPTSLAKFFRQQTDDTASGLVGTDFVAFLVEWDEDAEGSESFLARARTGIILEYDLARTLPASYAVPGIFFVTGHYPKPDPIKLYEDPAATVAALHQVAGYEPDPGELRLVERVCVGLADAGIHVSHAGVMPGRPHRAIRLVALDFDYAILVDGLESIQWPGDPAPALNIISSFDGVVSSRGGLGITVTPQGLLPRLDLEFSRKTENDSSTGALITLDSRAWNPLIDRLEERGWCLPAKAAGLREWPRFETLFGRDGVYQIRQVLNHVKVVVDQGAIYGKGYAGMDVRKTA